MARLISRIIFAYLIFIVLEPTLSYAGQYDQFGIYCSGYWIPRGAYGGHECVPSTTNRQPSGCPQGTYSYNGYCIPNGQTPCQATGGRTSCGGNKKCSSNGNCIGRGATECGEQLCYTGQTCLASGCHDTDTIDNCGNSKFCTEGNKCWWRPHDITRSDIYVPDSGYSIALKKGLTCLSPNELSFLNKFIAEKRKKQFAKDEEIKRLRAERQKRLKEEKLKNKASNIEKARRDANLSRERQEEQIYSKQEEMKQNALKSRLKNKTKKLKTDSVIYPGNDYYEELKRTSGKEIIQPKKITPIQKAPLIKEIYSGKKNTAGRNCPNAVDALVSGVAMCDESVSSKIRDQSQKNRKRIEREIQQEIIDKKQAADKRNAYKYLLPSLPKGKKNDEYTGWVKTPIRTETRQATGIHYRPTRKCKENILSRESAPKVETCQVFQKCRYHSRTNARECKGGESTECQGNWHCE